MSHTPSEFIILKIKEFEGCRLKAYKCPAGVLTIGYGITNEDKMITGIQITPDLEITQETADKWLKKSLIQIYAPIVEKYDNIYHWNQNQFDALLSFTYNIGTINQLTNNGKRSIQEISNAIELYNKCNGKPLSGLIRRRKFEKQLFDTPCDNLNALINNNNNNNNNGLINDKNNNNLKSNDTIAEEVIKGLWGNNEDRKKNLENSGYNYQEIQKIVNQKCRQNALNKGNTFNGLDKEEIARKVIRGEYGNGNERKKKLEEEGYDYKEIQNLVNILIKNL